MNRILSRLLLLLLIPDALGQTASTQPQTVNTTAPVIPAQTLNGTAKVPAQTASCTIGRNGGTCKINLAAITVPVTVPTPQIQLAPLTVTIPGQTNPVNLSGFTGSLACQLSSTGSFLIDPNGNITITGLSCTVTKQ